LKINGTSNIKETLYMHIHKIKAHSYFVAIQIGVKDGDNNNETARNVSNVQRY
jgi:hypothetical protein